MQGISETKVYILYIPILPVYEEFVGQKAILMYLFSDLKPGEVLIDSVASSVTLVYDLYIAATWLQHTNA